MIYINTTPCTAESGNIIIVGSRNTTHVKEHHFPNPSSSQELGNQLHRTTSPVTRFLVHYLERWMDNPVSGDQASFNARVDPSGNTLILG